MSLPRDDQILLRVGGRTWARYGVPWRRQGGPERDAYAFARSETARFFDATGVLHIAAANLPRLDPTPLLAGTTTEPVWLLEGLRTNPVLHNRDLTNAAWVKSGGGGVSAVKDQTGIDGVASSASRITATGANGTCLQSVTLASSARFQTCYVKRLVGSGTIEMTMDNGSTWTPITVTSAWTRVSIPTQTLANPVLGFRIVTSADSIAVDVVQNENGVYATSPIVTTTGAVQRSGETPVVPVGFPRIVCSLYVDYLEYGTPYATMDTRVAVIGGATFVAPYVGIQRFQNTGLRAIYDSGSGLVGTSFMAGGNPGDRVRGVARLYSDGHIEFERRLNNGSSAAATPSGASSLGAGGWNAQTLRLNGGNGGAAEAIGLVDCIVFDGSFTLAECEAVA